jgi:8-oxo-dGTP diphosphatase
MIVVGAIILNESGKFLLQQRDEHAPSFKNCWTLFGGRVELKETPKDALLRELDEELSLTAESILSIKQIQTNIDDIGTEQIIYELHMNVSLDQLTLNEGRDMRFVSVDQLFDRMFAFNIEQVLRTYLGTEPIPSDPGR